MTIAYSYLNEKNKYYKPSSRVACEKRWKWGFHEKNKKQIIGNILFSMK